MQQPTTTTGLLLASVIAALFAIDARFHEMEAALGVLIVCVAFATARQVMMATTVANSIAAHGFHFVWGCFGLIRSDFYKKSRWFGKTETGPE